MMSCTHGALGSVRVGRKTGLDQSYPGAIQNHSTKHVKHCKHTHNSKKANQVEITHSLQILKVYTS